MSACRYCGSSDGPPSHVYGNRLGNAVGAIIDTGNHTCTGPEDVADAIYRLTAERDAYRVTAEEGIEIIGDLKAENALMRAALDDFFKSTMHTKAVKPGQAVTADGVVCDLVPVGSLFRLIQAAADVPEEQP